MEDPKINTEGILSIEQVAKLLSVTPVTVKSYMNREVNPLPATRLTQNTVRILKTQLYDWLDSQTDKI